MRFTISIDRPSSVRPLRLIVLTALVVGVFLIGVTFAYGMRHRVVLGYNAFVASNPDPGGCLGSVGLYTDLESMLSKPPGSATAYKHLAELNTPSDVSINVDTKVYDLSLDHSSSLAGNEQIAWSFKMVRLGKATAMHLIGKRAIIHYKIANKRLTAAATVVDGRCKSLI